MTVVRHVQPVPVGQQGTSRARRSVGLRRSRRVARGSLQLTTGTGQSMLPDNPERLDRSQSMLDENHRY
jgi:hypothetical protein